jgi:hypothetical protein
MTKPSAPFTFADAAKRAIAGIADADLARLLGPRWNSLKMAWQDVDNPRLPRIDQALALDLAYAAAGGNGLPFFDAFEIAVSRLDKRAACIVTFARLAGILAKEYGDLVAATHGAMLPNASPRDKHRALVEVQDVIVAAAGLASQLLSQCEPDAGSWAQITGGIS